MRPRNALRVKNDGSNVQFDQQNKISCDASGASAQCIPENCSERCSDQYLLILGYAPIIKHAS